MELGGGGKIRPGPGGVEKEALSRADDVSVHQQVRADGLVVDHRAVGALQVPEHIARCLRDVVPLQQFDDRMLPADQLIVQTDITVRVPPDAKERLVDLDPDSGDIVFVLCERGHLAARPVYPKHPQLGIRF